MPDAPTPCYASALYDAKICFTVSLESGRVERVEIFTNSLDHFDTGLDVSPGDRESWARHQRRAEEIIRENGLVAPISWNTEP